MGSSSVGLQHIEIRVSFVIRSDQRALRFSLMKRAPSTISTELGPASLCFDHHSSTELGRRKGITVKFNQSSCHWPNSDNLLNSLLASTGLCAGLLVSGKSMDREPALLPISNNSQLGMCKYTYGSYLLDCQNPRKNTKVALQWSQFAVHVCLLHREEVRVRNVPILFSRRKRVLP